MNEVLQFVVNNPIPHSWHTGSVSCYTVNTPSLSYPNWNTNSPTCSGYIEVGLAHIYNSSRLQTISYAFSSHYKDQQHRFFFFFFTSIPCCTAYTEACIIGGYIITHMHTFRIEYYELQYITIKRCFTFKALSDSILEFAIKHSSFCDSHITPYAK